MSVKQKQKEINIMLISIDHGNKQIKTKHKTFVAGLYESDTRPPFGKNVLYYNDKYYSLVEKRIPYMRDKTVDERYFKLAENHLHTELAFALGVDKSEVQGIIQNHITS